ncbi:uncharacterized protein LOC126845006 [Adelges cooleyi]|uniref:uncharacterized protein LOC126845006 n=1 Tax=Adelges cooleyi TaxID=133065 RepID=UPI00217F5821|nr:uncharacterized protein LOC126845006 [Adelges cooleyi]
MTYLCNNLDFSDPERHRPPFVVVETDYVSYATVFMCIKMDTGRFRHYVSILSRTLDLDPKLLNDLMRDLIDVNETLQLKHVYHEDCNYESLVADTNDENVTDSENDDKKPYVTIKWMRQPTPEGGV